jgi:hypothetical protein
MKPACAEWLVPFSYFCNCWKLMLMALPRVVWLILAIIRRHADPIAHMFISGVRGLG